VCVCVCVCVCDYLINHKYFNNLNEDENMVGIGIRVGIYTSSYPIEKIEDSSYSYPYTVNADIFYQNKNEFGQYPQSEFICHLYFTYREIIFK